MKDFLNAKLANISTYLNNAKDECDMEMVYYYQGQIALLESLLKEITIEPLSDWECYEGTLHSANECCDCPSYDHEHWDILSSYQDELNWYKQQEIDDMYNKYNHYSWWMPKNILSVDNLWFTSDEIEAFRVIWQRRISAI
jgi:hypothetical protein